MAAISQKIGSIIGGVSQQPDTIKFAGQLRVCDNYYPDVTTGLIKRPGLQGIKKLDNVAADGTWTMIFRDDTEKYIIQFSKSGNLKIWSASNGLQQTINAVATEATAYATHTLSSDLQLLQINDYIFVLNRNITVAEGNTLSASKVNFAFVNINTVAYSSTYKVTLNGTDYTYTTPATGSQLNVDDIVNGLIAVIPGGTYSSIAVGNTIFIQRIDTNAFSIEAKGGTTGVAIEAFNGEVPAVAKLPQQFVDNIKVKVAGSADANEDDYWVIFKTSNGSSYGAGTWEETIAPDTQTSLNEETMPHVIIREANGTFTYRKLDEASAIASAGTTIVSGIPDSISILSATTGGHTVGEVFSPTGGTGNNLRLRVDKVRSNTITNSYTYDSSSYVELLGTQMGRTFEYYYSWVLNGKEIGTTYTDELNDDGMPVLIQGNTTYTVNSDFQIDYDGNYDNMRAGFTSTQKTNGIIDLVSIDQAGQGYTALNIVYNTSGDSFRINSVYTGPLEGDVSRLNYWKPRVVGDSETNPMPSFVGFPLDAISFFKNRLVVTSRQNVICSQAGDYFNFFASTVITIIDSDPIDISASSLLPIRFKYAVPAPKALLLFGDNAQYILETTTEAFSPKTAEVNRLATFSQSDKVSPLDIGATYAFIEEGEKATSVYEMDIKDNLGGKPDIVELTRLIPSYIPSAVKNMKYSSSANTLAILSSADNTKDLSYLYMWRYFLQGSNRVSGWFRWKLPGTIETFDFDQDIMYIITKQGNNYILSKVSLLTETPSQSLLFEDQYLDVRLDLFDYNPTCTYDSVANLTHVCFKDGFENTNEQAVLMYLNSDIAGSFEEQTLQYDASKPAGQKYFLTVEGNQTSSKFAIGYKYESIAQLPSFYFVKDNSRTDIKDTLNIPRVSRININSYNSGPYKVTVTAEGRNEFSKQLPQINANYYKANNIPIIRNAQSSVPILAKGNQVEVRLIADSPFPTAFTSIDWEGTYNNKGVSSL